MEISARELRSLVADVDDVHHEGMRTMPEEGRRAAPPSSAPAGASSRRPAWPRRRRGRRRRSPSFARRAPPRTTSRSTSRRRPSPPASSWRAVAAYQAAGGRGLLDDATLGLATTFAGHHQDHAGTFNGLLTANGADAVTMLDQGLLDQFGPLITDAADAPALLEIAYTLEMAAAATYVAALGMLTIPDAALAVSQILPVEAQHALVLATALGKPIDEQLPAFETTDNSLLSN